MMSNGFCNFFGIFSDPEGMNYRDASIRGIGDFACGDQLTQLDRGRTETSIRGIGDFACGDQLTQLDRGRTESPARSIFAMLSIAV